jgi:hypothetical protein
MGVVRVAASATGSDRTDLRVRLFDGYTKDVSS